MNKKDTADAREIYAGKRLMGNTTDASLTTPMTPSDNTLVEEKMYGKTFAKFIVAGRPYCMATKVTTELMTLSLWLNTPIERRKG